MSPAADKNYFELYGLPASFNIDLADLADRYRNLARATHPDRFAGGSDAERRVAIQMTAVLNEAFRVLKHPIARAQYLLELRGTGALEADVAAAFLVEQMELRERLESARGDRDGLAQLAIDVGQQLRDREQALATYLAADTWQATQARRTLQEMQYLDKLRQQLIELEEASG
jgi:molecular chaperone HscB